MKSKRLSIVSIFLVIIMILLSGCQQPVDVVNTEEPAVSEQTVQENPEDDFKSILSEEEGDLSIRYAKGENGAVATANPIASKIGLEILKKGGNAVDAAVAASFAMGLVEPNASGPGGSGYMLIHDNNTKTQTYYDYMEKSPESVTYEQWLELYSEKKVNNVTAKAACIPGAVHGWLTALEENGTMEPAEVLETVIQVAEEGFKVAPHLGDVFIDQYENIMLNDETAKVFTNDGLPYERGDIFKNPDYAKVLRKIASDGIDGFYKGEVAQAIVDSVQAEGGFFTMEDMANYTTKKREAIRTNYRGYEIVAAAPSSTGGVPIIETLNILENYDLASLEPDSPEFLHLFSQASYIANNDRYQYVGDPDFSDFSKGLITKEYANVRVKEIDETKAMTEAKKVNPADYESGSTTHISVIDKDGNMVAVTNTVGYYFGCKSVPKGTGFVLNNHLFNFSKSWEPNLIESGKRPRSTMSPILILKDGEPYVSVGTPGGARIVSTMVQIISHIIDHDMSLQEAIDYPRIHMWNKMPLFMEAKWSKDVQDKLTELGYEISLKKDVDSYFGGVQGIVIDPETQERYGAADKRRDGKALAY